MKFYMRDPAAAVEGMDGLSLEQIGAYNLLLDHIYCRDGVLADDDDLVARMLHIDRRRWRRLKAELMGAGKLRTADGMINANGVSSTLLRAKVRSKSAQSAANVRWTNYKKAKQINQTAMLSRNTSINRSIEEYSSTSLEVRAENADRTKEAGEKSALGSGELEAIIRGKGWIK